MEPYEMPNGKWAYNFMYQGKRYRKQGIRTKTEAKSRIRNILSDAAKGVDANSNELFADYFERWLEVNKMGKIEDKSYSRHLSTLDKVKEFFPASTRIKDIDQMSYQEFINHHAENMVKDSVKKVHEPIKAALDDAVYNGMIQRNPAYKAHIWGKKKSKEEKYKYVQLEVYINLKEYFKRKNSASGLLLYILLITGGRFSEVNTMKYSYLDTENNTIYLNGTKTDTSKRTMSLAPSDMQYILERIDALKLNKRGHIFGLSHNAAEKTFKAAKKVFKIPEPVTIGALRHTHCSFLYNHGVSIHYISKRLGHKNIKVTLDTYNHLFEEKYERDDDLAIEILHKMPRIKEDVA